jgi:hypothetical protein
MPKILGNSLQSTVVVFLLHPTIIKKKRHMIETLERSDTTTLGILAHFRHSLSK